MPKTSRRGPRKWTPAVCEYAKCPRKGDEFLALRTTARYCSDSCRTNAYKDRKIQFRGRVKKLHGGACDVCGGKQPRMFVWTSKDAPAEITKAHLLCGKHHTLMSMTAAAAKRRIKWLEARNLPIPEDLASVVA